MPRVFDYEKKYTYKDNFNREHTEYYPMRYVNSVNTSVPTVSGTWVNYGTGASSTVDTNNCPVEITNGVILNSGSLFSRQISCKPHIYNAGNYYNFPAASASTSDPATSSICPKGWSLPDNNGKTSYSNLLIAYGIDNSASKVSKTYDAALLNLPLSFLRSGAYNNGSLNYQGGSGGYRMTSLSLNFGSGDLAPTYGTNPSRGNSVRCVSR